MQYSWLNSVINGLNILITKEKLRIQLVTDLGSLWESSESQKDEPVNACIVHDKKDYEYYVFMTSDTTKTAK